MRDNLLCKFEPCQQRFVDLAGNRHTAHTDRLAGRTRSQVLPDLLGQERHERMEHLHQPSEQRPYRSQCRAVGRSAVGRLDHFEQPAAELVPEEAVGLHQRIRDAVRGEILLDLRQRLRQLVLEPLDRQPVAFALGKGLVLGPAADQLICVPYLVAEITALLAERLVEHQVVAGRRAEHHRNSYTVGTVLVDQVQRIGRVAQLFRHLAADLVAHDTGKVYVRKWLFAAVFVSGHDHSRHPEEDDVGRRNQIRRRIIIFYFVIVGVADTVEDRDRPQPRREPCIEHILVLTQVTDLQRHVAALFAGQLQSLFGCLGNHIPALGQVVGRNALPPPQLARDTPVLDVLHPVAVDIPVLLRHETYLVVEHCPQSRFGNLLHRHEPLHRQFRFDGHARTLRIAHVVGVCFGLLEQAGRLEVLLDLLADSKAVHADIHADLVVDRTVVVENIDCFERILLAEHVVVDVVRRRNLQRTRTETYIHIAVADQGYRTPHERHDDTRTLRQRCITLIFGIDAQRRIAQNGLRTRRGNYDITVRTLDGIAQVVEFSVRLAVDHLFVREGRLRRRIPVDHPHAAIYLALVVKVHEYLDHALGADLVHRKACTIPVARSSQLAQLLQDDATVLLLPLPGVAQELLARQARLLDTLGPQFGNNLRFGSDRGVVGTRNPAGILAHHTGTAHQHILQRIVQHVSHVEHSGHIGRRNDYGIRFTLIGRRMEEFVVYPVVVPLALDLAGVVLVSHIHNLQLSAIICNPQN